MIGYIKEGLLLLFGICGGGLVAAGVYAFITILGLVPRLAARTHSAGRIRLYETCIILGSILGNIISLFPMDWRILSVLPGLGTILMTVWGTCTGIFVGCLVMSLAETLDTVPVINRRIGLRTGMQYIILSIGLGKTAGALIFFVFHMAAQ